MILGVKFSHRNCTYAIRVVNCKRVDSIEVFENLLCQGCEIMTVRHMSDVNRIRRFRASIDIMSWYMRVFDFVIWEN